MTSQPNTIDDILERFYRIAASSEPHNDSGKYRFTELGETKAALLEAIKAAKPEKKDYNGGEWHPKQWCPRNNAIDEYEQNLTNLFGGES